LERKCLDKIVKYWFALINLGTKPQVVET